MPGREGGGGSSYMQKWNQTGDLYNRTYSHAVPLVHASDRRSKRGRGKRRPVTRRACWLKVFSDCWCTGRRESLPTIPSKGDCRQVVIVLIHPTVLALTRALQSQGCIQQKQVKKRSLFCDYKQQNMLEQLSHISVTDSYSAVGFMQQLCILLQSSSL